MHFNNIKETQNQELLGNEIMVVIMIITLILILLVILLIM